MAASMAASQQRLALGAKQATCGPAAFVRPAQTTVSAKRTGAVVADAVHGCVPMMAGARRLVSSRVPRQARAAVVAQAAAGDKFDYDLVIIGCGVGGHGAALHAVECGLKVAVIEGHDIGGTCVNRGCVPSKALLAASGRVREMRDKAHLAAMGVQVGSVSFDRQGIANHAKDLATTIQGNLRRSLEAIGVDILIGQAKFVGNQRVRYGLPGRVDVGGEVTARDIIIATGSVPFVPPGIPIDGKTVFTSDHALKLEWLPNWIAIIGSGYIGLEFSDVYTALGTEVTFIEAVDNLMPGFDREIARLAQRLLIQGRPIDYHTGVIASKVTPGVPGVKPVVIELTDFKTKEKVDEIEVDACLVATGRAPYTSGLNLGAINSATDRRGFVPVNEKMQVLDTAGNVVPHVYCIGDANGKYMLAHAASAQGISAVENICSRPHVLNHLSVPAACFTHPEVSFVGVTQEKAEEMAKEQGFKLGVSKTSFKGNSKALAEKEGDGMAKMLYRKDTGEILGVHIIGLHAADLIHEASNAIATGQRVQDIKFNVHAHPTLSEVLDELFKGAHVEAGANGHVATAATTDVEAPEGNVDGDGDGGGGIGSFGEAEERRAGSVNGGTESGSGWEGSEPAAAAVELERMTEDSDVDMPRGELPAASSSSQSSPHSLSEPPEKDEEEEEETEKEEDAVTGLQLDSTLPIEGDGQQPVEAAAAAIAEAPPVEAADGAAVQPAAEGSEAAAAAAAGLPQPAAPVAAAPASDSPVELPTLTSGGISVQLDVRFDAVGSAGRSGSSREPERGAAAPAVIEQPPAALQEPGPPQSVESAGLQVQIQPSGLAAADAAVVTAAAAVAAPSATTGDVGQSGAGGEAAAAGLAASTVAGKATSATTAEAAAAGGDSAAALEQDAVQRELPAPLPALPAAELSGVDSPAGLGIDDAIDDAAADAAATPATDCCTDSGSVEDGGQGSDGGTQLEAAGGAAVASAGDALGAAEDAAPSVAAECAAAGEAGGPAAAVAEAEVMPGAGSSGGPLPSDAAQELKLESVPSADAGSELEAGAVVAVGVAADVEALAGVEARAAAAGAVDGGCGDGGEEGGVGLVVEATPAALGSGPAAARGVREPTAREAWAARASASVTGMLWSAAKFLSSLGNRAVGKGP
ncbi:hypothetical protein PLESTM_001832300 [Pleodorina starrii]|nr:hypothetical protein PLESTM_001832300 [Pleodorina starrii]